MKIKIILNLVARNYIMIIFFHCLKLLVSRWRKRKGIFNVRASREVLLGCHVFAAYEIYFSRKYSLDHCMVNNSTL